MSEDVQLVAKNITDLGLMAVTAAFFLVLSGLMWLLIFKWFKKIIDDLIQSIKSMMTDLLSETRKQNDMLNDISEGMRSETRERLKTLSSTFFDLAMYRVLSFIKRVKKENHIADKEATLNKINRFLTNLHSDRKSKFDNFSSRGRNLSEFVNPEWVVKVSDVVEKEVYDDEPNEDRTYSNVKNVYDDIKVDFYERVFKK